MKAGHGGVVMGSELSGGIKNVFVENCRMSSPDLDRGIRIKTNAMRGGGVENLNVRELEVGTVRDLIVINFYYEEGDNGPFAPVVSDINMNGIHCANAERVMDIRGFKHAPIRDINLFNVTVDKATLPSRISNVEDLDFDNVTVNGTPVFQAGDLLTKAKQ